MKKNTVITFTLSDLLRLAIASGNADQVDEHELMKTERELNVMQIQDGGEWVSLEPMELDDEVVRIEWTHARKEYKLNA